MHPRPQPGSGAEAFARMLDGVAEVRSWDDSELVDLPELVAVTHMLERVAAPTPRPDFVANLRAELMAADLTTLRDPEPPVAESAAAVIDLAARRKRKATRRAYTAAAIGSMVLSTAGVAAAAQNALPGSSLYGVKRAIETVELSFATSDTARGHDLLNQARTRLKEVNELSSRGGNADLIQQTLRLFSNSASEGTNLLFTNFQQKGNASSLDTIRSFAADATKSLNAIPETVIAANRAQLLEASSLVANVEQQSKLLCPTCAALPPLTAQYQELLAQQQPSSTNLAPLLAVPHLVVKQPTNPATTVTSAPPTNTAAPTRPTNPTTPTKPTNPSTPTAPTPVVTGLGQTLTGVTKPVGETVGAVLEVTTGLVGGVTNLVGGLLGGGTSK